MLNHVHIYRNYSPNLFYLPFYLLGWYYCPPHYNLIIQQRLNQHYAHFNAYSLPNNWNASNYINQNNISRPNKIQIIMTSKVKQGQEIIYNNEIRIIYDIYDSNMISLCLVDEDGFQYTDSETDELINISEIKLINN